MTIIIASVTCICLFSLNPPLKVRFTSWSSLFFFSFLKGDYKKGLRRGKNNLGFYTHKSFQLFYLCLTGFFLPAIISKSHILLLSVLSWQIKHKRRRISYLLASDTNKFCIPTQWNEKPLPVERSSSHFSCIVADMFNFFVSQVSNEAAIVSKVLSKFNCGRERRVTILNGLAGGCPDMGERRQGQGEPEELENWRTKIWV